MERVKLRRWQLLRWRVGKEVADLRGAEVVAVGKRAFAGQVRLEEVLMPPTLSVIKTAAFADCARLHTVTLVRTRSDLPPMPSATASVCARLRAVKCCP